MSGEQGIEQIREEIDRLNMELLAVLNRRAELVSRLGPLKEELGLPAYDPLREAAQIQRLQLANRGPLSAHMVADIFRAIFGAALQQQLEGGGSQARLATARSAAPVPVVVGTGLEIGGGRPPVIIAGPCAVEDRESLEQVAALLARRGLPLLRAGAFKPRKSPYSFQGLGMAGVELLAEVGARHGLATVSEVTGTDQVEEMARRIDLLQVGAANMANYDLLKRLSQVDRPVLLKRGWGARVEEWLLAAEYLLAGGNRRVILCERGIRTFENATRFTLDISAVALVKERTDLPVIVDLSHAAGRVDLLERLGPAALAAGADGLMVEVHPTPARALSDGAQQMSLEQFERFLDRLAGGGESSP